MITTYTDDDDSDGDEESEDIEFHLYSHLHYGTSSASATQTEEGGNGVCCRQESAIIDHVSGESTAVLANLDKRLVPHHSRGLSTWKKETETEQYVELDSDLEGSDITLEEWMLLDREEVNDDPNIQLNLDFSGEDLQSSKQEDQAGDQNLWAISDRDKQVMFMSSLRYFIPGIPIPDFLSRAVKGCCHCRKTGHVARNCPQSKRRDCCVLCGQVGHRQTLCPSRPCPLCGLPTNAHPMEAWRPTKEGSMRRLRPNHPVPPARHCHLMSHYNQPCRRCGVFGHLPQTCPDLWRQYHQTTCSTIPVRPTGSVRKPRLASCYNCGKRGHYGHECSGKRMSDAPIMVMPYVCHYDTAKEPLSCQTATLWPIRGTLKTKPLKRTCQHKWRERKQERKRLKREQAREHLLKRENEAKVASECTTQPTPLKSASITPLPAQRPVVERRRGPLWTARVADRRRKAGGRGARNLYPLDSTYGKAKANRRRR